MTDQHTEGLSAEDAALVERVTGRRLRTEFNDMVPREWQNRDLARLLSAARKEGAARSGLDRDRLATLVGSWFVSGDPMSDECEVIHDQFPGDYDQRTAAVYRLADAIIALSPPLSDGVEELRPSAFELASPRQFHLDGWRPIATAAVDCWLVVSGLSSGVGPGRWVDIGNLSLDGEWLGQHGILYTPDLWFDLHNLPLPAPPVGTGETSKGGA